MTISSIVPIPTHVVPTQVNTIKPVPPNGYQKVKKTDKDEKSKDTPENTKDKNNNRSDRFEVSERFIDTSV